MIRLLAALVAASALCAASGRGQAPSAIHAVRVASGLNAPVFVTAPPGDLQRIFVVEQATGRIRIVKQGALLAAPFLDLLGKITGTGESGLLGLAFHPKYSENGSFFVAYSDLANATTISRFRVSGDPDVALPASETVVLKFPQPFVNHNGGMIAFGPDGRLYIALGDGGSGYDPLGNAQSLSSPLGKILRIDVDLAAAGVFHSVPADNPFVGVPGAVPEIWHYGLRNPWRFSFDRLTGDLYVADVGQDWMEEIDFHAAGAPGGKNFGWRCLEGTAPVVLAPCSPPPASAVPPIHEYPHTLPGCAVIGGFVYRGSLVPDLRGTYFFAEWCKGKIFSFRYVGGAVVDLQDRTAELVPVPIGSISSFGQDAAGELYFCAWSNGEVYKILPVSPSIQGVVSFGTGTAGCNGPTTLGANSSPVLGSTVFRVRVSNAVPSAVGLLLVSDQASPNGWVVPELQVLLHLQIATATELLLTDIATGANGAGSVAIPIPNDPALVGRKYFLQSLWSWGSTGLCSLPPVDMSSSDALEVEILP